MITMLVFDKLHLSLACMSGMHYAILVFYSIPPAYFLAVCGYAAIIHINY